MICSLKREKIQTSHILYTSVYKYYIIKAFEIVP